MIDFLLIVSFLAAAQPDTGTLPSAHSTVPGIRAHKGNENVLVSGVPQIVDELRDALALSRDAPFGARGRVCGWQRDVDFDSFRFHGAASLG